MCSLLYGVGDLVTKDTKKSEVLNAFSASVFTGKTFIQESQVSGTEGKLWSAEDFSLMKEDQIGEHLNYPDKC